MADVYTSSLVWNSTRIAPTTSTCSNTWRPRLCVRLWSRAWAACGTSAQTLTGILGSRWVPSKEAVIAWTAPAAYKAEAGPFVERALNRHFNGKPWNFTHTDMQLRSKPWSGGSQVVHRHRKDPLRMPSSMYTKGAPARHRV